MFRTFIVSTLLLSSVTVLSAAELRRRSVPFPQTFPQCSMITGSGAVTFTRDQGATLTPAAVPLSGIGYTYGLAVLDAPSTLLAWHKSDLILSTDDGCSWRVVASFDDYDFPPRITPAKGGRAYAWSDNRSFLVRYDSRGARKLKQPVDFVGLGVDRNNADHVRAGGSDGTIWESIDGGESWSQIGVAPRALIVYRIAFDPSDLDHVLAGTAVNSAYVTRDGGRSWTQSRIDADNVFEVIVSPADSNVVWAQGIDLADETRHIYRSIDGGTTFVRVIDQTADIHMINGSLLAPDPANRDVLYFVFGTFFQNYGTDIYRYDAARNVLTMTHNNADDVNSIAFSPARSHLMYLGLEVERGTR